MVLSFAASSSTLLMMFGVWGGGGGACYSQVVSIGVHSYTQGRAGIIEGSVPIFFLFSLLRIDDTD
jgi:hypothetical protein